jgi:uncharacterized membrane protein
MQPQVKLAIALGLLFLSLMAMMQTVRLSVHLSFLLRAVPADPQRAKRLARVAFAMNRRCSLYFSVGLRLGYVFFPMFLYILGPLALLISTIVEVTTTSYASRCLVKEARQDTIFEHSKRTFPSLRGR